MNAPDLFSNFWADDSEKITFQEILTRDLQPQTIEVIKTTLYNQLVSEKLTELFPNIDWSNPRSFEKWEHFSNSILFHIALPENVWNKWIQLMEPQAAPIENIEEETPSYLQNPYPAYEEPIQTEEDLLTAEVYFVTEEDLEPIAEPQDWNEEIPTINQAQAMDDKTEVKVFEALQVNDAPLLKKVESQLVEKLSSSISLYQSIHFTKELFEGNTQRFQKFIQFVDENASAHLWKKEIEEQFPSLLNSENTKALEELLSLIEKKFN